MCNSWFVKETTSPTFVASEKFELFPIKNPVWTETENGNAIDAPIILKDTVSTTSNIRVEITSISYGSIIVLTFASAVTSAFVPVLSNTKGSFTWNPFPLFVIFIVTTWSLEVLATVAAAPNPSVAGSVITNCWPSK